MESRDGQHVAGLMVVMADVEPEFEAEYNEWLESEHIPERLGCPGFVAARRYIATLGSPQYLTVYDLEGPQALDTPEYLRLREEPSAWTVRMRPHLRNGLRNGYSELARRY